MLGSQGAPELTVTSVTSMQSGTRSTVFAHLPLFGISHHTPDSPADSPCRFSVFRLLTLLIESNFTDTSCGTSKRRRDVKTREMLTEPAMLPSLLSGELKMEQRYPVPTRPSLHPIRAGLMHPPTLLALNRALKSLAPASGYFMAF